ncbi:MAG: immunoglobulin domain-containing protein [Phycisphaerae bacterium]|nr:immunoglobulin domain-containing protein [Phycisphaerae bacterium]
MTSPGLTVKSVTVAVLAVVVLLASTVSFAAVPDVVPVVFRSDQGLYAVTREVPQGADPLQAALDALTAGPTETELANGLFSALPWGAELLWVTDDGDQIAVDFSAGLLSAGADEARVQDIYEQIRWTVDAAGYGSSVRVTVEGVRLPDFLPPVSPVGTRPEGPTASPLLAAAGTALAGRDISLSPGHGYRWGGSSWVYDRPVYCAPLSREDIHNVELCIYLNTYLEQDGATVLKYRCHNKAQGNDPYTGSPWWYMSGSYWLKQIGYPCSVYASSSGDCTLGAGGDESSDCIRSRPYAANYDGTDLHIAMHTNGYTGDCYGGSCPNGTATYYDGSDGTYGPPSMAFGQSVQNAIVSVIRSQYGDATWRDRGVINDDGGFAETRIPNRPSILIELAFHDSCDRDALYLRDEFFRSATMWGVYKGICDYLGTTPTYDFYSCEYVSDTIPPTMTPGQSYPVSLTLRNRGVLWTEAKSIRLGAVGDSDPFTTQTRVTIAGEVGPNETYTFNFTLTAPTTPGLYTTDWRMLREWVTWFGPIHSEGITVGTGPFPPAITLDPVSQEVLVGSPVSFTVAAAGTEPLSYQWQKNSVDLSDDGRISGSTTPTLTINPTQGADSGDYRCVVTNAHGSDTSAVATLTVQVGPIVYIVESRENGLNYNRFSRLGDWADSTGKSTAPGTTGGIGSLWSSTAYAGRSATYSFTPDYSGEYDVSATWSNSTNACPSAEHIISHAGGSTTVFMNQLTGGNMWNSLGQYTLNAGTTYTVVQRTDGSTGGGVYRADAVKWELAVLSVDPPAITQHPASQSVCAGVQVVFNVAATGDAPLAYRWQKDQSNLSDGGHYSGVYTPTLTVTGTDASDAAAYRCVVTNDGGSTPSNEATLSLKTATQIMTHPGSQVLAWGETVNLSVVAAGDGEMSYQWQKNTVDMVDDGHYAGVTTPTLVISDADRNDEASYRCVVTADCGSVPSNVAAVTVGVPGDFDADSDVDLMDFGTFQFCFNGPNRALPYPSCTIADFDFDDDVDLGDFSMFASCFNGPNRPPAAGCP